MFVYLFIAVFLLLLYIPLSMMWPGKGPSVPDDDAEDDWRLMKTDSIEDAFRYNRAGGAMHTDGMGDRPLDFD